MRALAIAVVCGGCLIVPKTHVEPVRAVEVSHSAPACVETEPSLALEVRGPSVVVRAKRQRRCRQDLVERLEGGEVTTAGLEIIDHAGGDPRGLVAAVLLAPFTMVISGVITAIVVETSQESAPTRKRTTELAWPVAAAGVQVEVLLASGRTLALTTDATGIAQVTIPDDEPEVGLVGVRLDPDHAISSRQYRMGEPCIADRAAIFARASHAPPQARHVILNELPECGDAEAHAWQVMREATLEALDSGCATIERSYATVHSLAPQLAEPFEAEPDLARCLRVYAAARASVPARP